MCDLESKQWTLFWEVNIVARLYIKYNREDQQQRDIVHLQNIQHSTFTKHLFAEENVGPSPCQPESETQNDSIITVAISKHTAVKLFKKKTFKTE